MPASDRLVAVAAHGLAGSRTDLPAAPLSDIEWLDLVQGCVAADLVGLLAAAADDGQLPVTAGQAEELAVLAAEHTGLSDLVDRQAVTLASLLAISGIGHRVVDGPARRLAYPRPAVRPSRAVRVLVAPEALDEARALQGVPTPTARRGLRHERVAVAASIAGLDRTPRPDLPALLGTGTPLDVDGRSVEVLTIEQQLVVSCAELTATPVPALVALRDVAQLALAPDLDAAAVRRLAEVAGVSDALTRGLAGAWTWFDLADKTELSVWAVRRAVPVAERQNRRAPAPTAPSRVGLAQRVFGRRPAAPAGAPSPSPATALVADTTHVAGPDGRGRQHRTTRRSR